MSTRTEKDSMGTLEVPADALWAAQTQRAINNFPISDLKMPSTFIKALGLIKYAASKVNSDLKLLESDVAAAIQKAALEIIDNKHDKEFQVDVFQTGSGTSSNMNSNEVIANLAKKLTDVSVHPNDHVNMSQSSNDVIPTAIHLSTAIACNETLLPGLNHLEQGLRDKAAKLKTVVKTGRTHLMDAMPVTFEQEFLGYAIQIKNNITRINNCLPRIHELAIGGTAVGTGINAHPKFAKNMCKEISSKTKLKFTSKESFFEALSSQDAIVELSGHLKNTACSLMKIANDLRLMNSGPLAGLGEIALPAIQPGSSIMPGKVNPVIPEALCMLCAQVIGNDTAITVGGQAGNFQLNVMLPMIAYNILQSVMLIGNGARVLYDTAIADLTINEDNIKAQLDKNPILVTALNPVIGYEKGAAIAKQAYKEGRAIIDVAKEQTDLSEAELIRLLDPYELTKGGIKG